MQKKTYLTILIFLFGRFFKNRQQPVEVNNEETVLELDPIASIKAAETFNNRIEFFFGKQGYVFRRHQCDTTKQL